jgi:hypothetical protein
MLFTKPTLIYSLHTILCVMPPFSPHQIIQSMQFTKQKFATPKRYFTINFGQIYLFCVKAMVSTCPSRPSPTHAFVSSAILYSVPLDIHRSLNCFVYQSSFRYVHGLHEHRSSSIGTNLSRSPIPVTNASERYTLAVRINLCVGHTTATIYARFVILT